MSKHENFLEEGRERWVAALHEALGKNPAAMSQWTDLDRMPKVLAPFMGQGLNHTYFPTGGGLTMDSVALGHERGTIEFRPTSGEAAYICKPTKLAIHYFANDPAQSFVYLTCAALKPTGTYDYAVDGQEELVETSPGEYHPRVVWDQGFLDHDEYGDEKPLPHGSRLALRFLRGNFMLVGNGSFWNGNAHTYDGEHDKLGEDQVHKLIEQVISEGVRG